MDPQIENSITRTGEKSWSLGSLYACELVVSHVPDDAVASWKVNGETFCIRNARTEEKERSTGSIESIEGQVRDSESDRIHHAGTSAAVWKIGGTYIKVKAWRDGMQLESDTIRFVNNDIATIAASSVPTPEIVFSWIDERWNRTFLVLKAVTGGQTLDQAWPSLSAGQRVQVADAIAQYCKNLALSTSEVMMTANQNVIVEQFLTVKRPDSEPSWRPQFLGPHSASQLRSYLLSAAKAEEIPSSTFDGQFERFYFYHADLGPTNIIVAFDENGSPSGRVLNVIDWESAAFYPRFWLGSKPLLSAGFLLSTKSEGNDRAAWARLLTSALERQGFPANFELYDTWRKGS